MDKEKLMDQYLQGRISETDQRVFDHLMATDPEFEETVRFRMDVRQVAQATEEEDFRLMVSEFETESRASQTPVFRVYRNWLVAASVVLIAGLSYLFFWAPVSSDALFEDHFSPYPNVVQPLVRGQESVDLSPQAFDAYQQADYETAARLFGELSETSDTPAYLFYQANALLALNRASEALPLLERYRESGESLSDKALWYQAMAELQLGNEEQASRYLKQLLSEDGYQAENAEKILRKLE